VTLELPRRQRAASFRRPADSEFSNAGDPDRIDLPPINLVVGGIPVVPLSDHAKIPYRGHAARRSS
jgi:hypothetical protein